MFSAPRSDAHTSPTREPGGQAGDLVDELQVARPDEHRDDRHAARDERLGLVGVERRRRDEVVVEAVEALGQVVEQRALGLDQARERVDEALGVVAGVGVRALGEQDADERPGALALGGGGEGRGGDLVGREPGWAARRSISATIPARASAPRRWGGRSATWVPAPWRLVT